MRRENFLTWTEEEEYWEDGFGVTWKRTRMGMGRRSGGIGCEDRGGLGVG